MAQLSKGACAVMLALLAGTITSAATAAPTAVAIPYGANKAASGTFVHDGVTL